jgi:glycine/D-amino acid oxidase-like deaminating enzyme
MMERSVEWFLAITAIVVGASHVLRSADWAEAFRLLHGRGRSGAFVNGGLSLIPGAAIVAGHGSWAWPGALVTLFGWLLVAKGVVCLILPDKALQSMARGAGSPQGFVAAGVVLLALGAWTWYCLVAA